MALALLQEALHRPCSARHNRDLPHLPVVAGLPAHTVVILDRCHRHQGHAKGRAPCPLGPMVAAHSAPACHHLGERDVAIRQAKFATVGTALLDPVQ